MLILYSDDFSVYTTIYLGVPKVLLLLGALVVFLRGKLHPILTLVDGCAHRIEDLLCLPLCKMLVDLVDGLGGLPTRHGFDAVSRFAEVFVLRGILKMIARANHDFRSVALAENFWRVNREVSWLGHRSNLVNAIVVVVRDNVCQLATTGLPRVLIVVGTPLLHNLEATIRDPPVI